MLQEIKNIKTGKKDISSFGITFGIILLVISLLLFYYDNETYKNVAIIAVIFIGFGLIIPILLKPIYIIWMIFAVILGWVMTRFILSIIFYLVMTPIGLITRFLGEDFLALKKIDSSSYWNQRSSRIEKSQDYEKQF